MDTTHMDINLLRAVSTVLCFGLFLGIVCWAFRARNRAEFEQAALLPFEPDEPQPNPSPQALNPQDLYPQALNPQNLNPQN